jgi:hypothetical protein
VRGGGEVQGVSYGERWGESLGDASIAVSVCVKDVCAVSVMCMWCMRVCVCVDMCVLVDTAVER